MAEEDKLKLQELAVKIRELDTAGIKDFLDSDIVRNTLGSIGLEDFVDIVIKGVVPTQKVLIVLVECFIYLQAQGVITSDALSGLFEKYIDEGLFDFFKSLLWLTDDAVEHFFVNGRSAADILGRITNTTKNNKVALDIVKDVVLERHNDAGECFGSLKRILRARFNLFLDSHDKWLLNTSKGKQ